jgi:alpha-tubulin suppressor-like RCC1 family protein
MESEDLFAYLPNETIIQIALDESIQYITNMCQISRRFNNLICNNDNFWRAKFIQDFGIPDNKNIISWKDAYINYGKVYMMNNNYKRRYMFGDLDDKLGIRKDDYIFNIKFPAKAKSISSGNGFMLILDTDNNVWSFGSNQYGKLGLGPEYEEGTDYPILLSWDKESKAKFITCGEDHSIIIDINDNVWSFGLNENGQLGLGDDNNRNIPILIPNFKAKFVACGGYHSVLIDMSDNVWTCGWNIEGQLGLGDNDNRNVFDQIPDFKTKFVSCGDIHTMFIDINDNVWGCGWNEYGQLGLGDDENKNIPTALFNIQAQSISCGWIHTIILDINNNIWVCGSNEEGQLGLNKDKQGTSIPEILIYRTQNFKAKSVSCGNYYTMIIDINNNLWGFGQNHNEQLGLELNEDIDDRYIFGLTRIPNFKAQSISCDGNITLMIELPGYVHEISFDKAIEKIETDDFDRYDVIPEYQKIPHNPRNVIMTFYAKDNSIYVSEVKYDQDTNQIFSPL